MTKVKEAPAKVAGFKLPEEKILVRYVKKQTGFIVNPKHVAYGGKLEGAFDMLPAKMDSSGKYKEVLTRDEQEGLEEILVVKPGYLSTHKPEDNFWDSVKIKVGKEGIVLDLSKPFEYINYKVLLTYDDLISPSILETKLKRSYKYEIVRTKDSDTKDKIGVNYNRSAYKLFDKIEDSNEQMAGVIRVLTGKSVAASDNDWLIKEIGKLIEKDAKRFVNVLTDPDYEIQLFIKKGISKKEIKLTRGKYTTKDGVALCEEGEVPTLINTINFLRNDKNQEIKLAIEAGY